jgi:peroxiredoxin
MPPDEWNLKHGASTLTSVPISPTGLLDCVKRMRTANRSLSALLLCCVWAGQGHAADQTPAVGSSAPDFTAKNLVTGEQVRLSSAQGKLVFLTFWATWCPPCRQELPILESVQRKLGKARVMVYAISFRDRGEPMYRVRKLAKAQDWQISLLEDPNGRIADSYGIAAIPHLFIIGRDGRILAVHTGYGQGSIDELVEDINSALRGANEAPAASEPAAPQ